MNNISLKILKEATEELSEGTIDEYCQYLYKDADGDIDNIPDYQETIDYFFWVSKREYNMLYKRVKQAIENVADHFYTSDYKTYIELSDRATMNYIHGNIDDVDPEASMWTYTELRDDAFRQFEEETGVEIWQAGRSGRHIVVDDTFYNAYHYNELCAAQEKWEDWVIDEFAKEYPFPEDEVKEDTQDEDIKGE